MQGLRLLLFVQELRLSVAMQGVAVAGCYEQGVPYLVDPCLPDLGFTTPTEEMAGSIHVEIFEEPIISYSSCTI